MTHKQKPIFRYFGLGGGFTLAEVCVVVALVGLVAALLAPVFLGAQEKARQSVCAGNLSQLYKAVAIYTQDNDGFRPLYGVGSFPVQVDGRDLIWPDQSAELVRCLQPYGAAPALWFCPDDPRGRVKSLFNRHPATSYTCQTAMFTPPTGPPQPVQLPPVGRSASGTFLFGDDILPCTPGGGTVPYLYTHSQQFNVVFCDGHAQAESVANAYYIDVCG